MGGAPRAPAPVRNILESPLDGDKERKKQLADLEKLKQSGREGTLLSSAGDKLGA